jgi:hypothetical protein
MSETMSTRVVGRCRGRDMRGSPGNNSCGTAQPDFRNRKWSNIAGYSTMGLRNAFQLTSMCHRTRPGPRKISHPGSVSYCRLVSGRHVTCVR